MQRRSLSFPPVSGCAETRIAPKKRPTCSGMSSPAAKPATARIPTASPTTAELYGPSVPSPHLPSLQSCMVGSSSLMITSSRTAPTETLYGSQWRHPGWSNPNCVTCMWPFLGRLLPATHPSWGHLNPVYPTPDSHWKGNLFLLSWLNQIKFETSFRSTVTFFGKKTFKWLVLANSLKKIALAPSDICISHPVFEGLFAQTLLACLQKVRAPAQSSNMM